MTDNQNEPPVKYTPEQQEIISGLVDAQTHLELSNKEFANRYLKTYTESTWSKLRNAQYRPKDLTKTFSELRTALNSIRLRIKRAVKMTQASKYYAFDQFSAMFKAVEECLEKKGENRLIVYVGPTGAGKSRFGAELGLREEVTLVRANESWFQSSLCAASDILRELDVTGKFVSFGEARRCMLEAMSGRAQVMFIDEGNSFGPRTINLVKDILNETEWTVVIAIGPAFWQKMRRHFAEWSQLQRRLHTVFHFESITAANAEEFLGDAGLNGDCKAAAVVLAKAANEFGGFDMINRVVERLAEKVDGHPTLDDVTKAIAFVRKQLDSK